MKMNKLAALFLAAALALIPVAAGASAPPDVSSGLFAAAKSAVVSMASGDYEQAALALPFGEASLTGDDLRTLAAALSTLSPDTVQGEISVAFWTPGGWVLAVPVTTPDSDSVEAVAFTSADGQSFSAYSVTTWGRVAAAYGDSDFVVWNKEYVSSNAIVIAD